MSTPPDPIIPTAVADQPAEARRGDYLAPPPVQRMPLSRSLPILLLCGTLLFNGVYVLLILDNSRLGGAELIANLALSGVLLVIDFWAAFRSHKWPTYALWVVFAISVAGFFLLSYR